MLNHCTTPEESEEKNQVGKSVVAIIISNHRIFESNGASDRIPRPYQDFNLSASTSNNREVFVNSPSEHTFSKSLKYSLRL